MNAGNLLPLLHLCDPALPIGGFSHSAGLETYVQEGVVHDTITAQQFVEQQLSENLFYTDAALASLAYDAAYTKDARALLQLDELATAVKLPEEMRVASCKLGTRLLKIFSQAEGEMLRLYGSSVHSQQAAGHYCIAFGVIASTLHILKADALSGFYYNAATGFITNSVKLVPLGQHDGQEILMSLFPTIEALVSRTMIPDKDLIGRCCVGFDVRCMQHEQLYSRLYMS